MPPINRNELRYFALRYLAGKSLYKWVREQHMEKIMEMAHTIRQRKARRGVYSFKQTVDGSEFLPSEPKSGGCSYCWPRVTTENYKGKLTAKPRGKNPLKLLDQDERIVNYN